MRPIAIALTLSLSLTTAAPALATTGALPKDQAIALAFAASSARCAAEGGTLRLPEDDPATAVDLTGDGTADDWIINEAGAFCGPDLGFLGGSGGNYIHAVVGTSVSSWFGGGWAIQDVAFLAEGEVGPPARILLLAVHGASCNSFGAAPCFIAAAWDEEKMISYAPEPEASSDDDTPPDDQP